MDGKALKTLQKKWQKEVYSICHDIDPDNEFCWRSLAMGWALAQGLSVEDANEFVNENPNL